MDITPEVLSLLKGTAKMFPRSRLWSVDDLVQEGAMALLKEEHDGNRSSLSSFVRNYGRFAMLDYMRARTRRWQKKEEETAAPESICEDSHDDVDFNDRLARTAEPMRTILEMRFRQDHTWDEIAKYLGITHQSLMYTMRCYIRDQSYVPGGYKPRTHVPDWVRTSKWDLFVFSLPPKQREVGHLYFKRDFSLERIADHMGIKRNSVLTLLNRVYARIQAANKSDQAA